MIDGRPAEGSAPFSIRPAGPGDDADIASLFTQLGYPILVDEVPARMAAVRADGGQVMVVVDDRGGAIGAISMARLRVIHAAGPVAYITGLITSEAARGRGIGRALVTAATEWARREGCVRISVTSAEHRADAHAFYPACGLPYTGRRFSIVIDQGITPRRATD